MKLELYRCKTCGNIVAMVKPSGMPIICCGKEMTKMPINSVDGVGEKHVPVISVTDEKTHVKIGAKPHPMEPEHYIEWVVLMTDRGFYAKSLNPGDEPKVCFRIKSDETVLTAYALCNIHGLWCKDR